MPGRSLYWVALVGIFLSLSGCVAFPAAWNGRPLVYNVRTASVLANGDVPVDLLRAVDRRVASAIATTRPPAGAERVVLLIRFDRMDKGFNARRPMDRAHITVTATSVETGEPVAEAKFVVNASMNDPRYVREDLAEQIAARIRFAFSLTIPRIRLSRPKPEVSTVLASDLPASQREAPRVTVTPPVAPQPERPAKPGTVDDGASGAVRLGSDCNAVADPDCLAAKP